MKTPLTCGLVRWVVDPEPPSLQLVWAWRMSSPHAAAIVAVLWAGNGCAVALIVDDDDDATLARRTVDAHANGYAERVTVCVGEPAPDVLARLRAMLPVAVPVAEPAPAPAAEPAPAPAAELAPVPAAEPAPAPAAEPEPRSKGPEIEALLVVEAREQTDANVEEEARLALLVERDEEMGARAALLAVFLAHHGAALARLEAEVRDAAAAALVIAGRLSAAELEADQTQAEPAPEPESAASPTAYAIAPTKVRARKAAQKAPPADPVTTPLVVEPSAEVANRVPAAKPAKAKKKTSAKPKSHRGKK